MRKTLLLVMALLLMVGAAAAETCDFDISGVRLTLPEDWQAITAENVAGFADRLGSLGTTPEAFTASLNASGGLCEVFTPAGVQLYLAAQTAPDALAGLDSFTSEGLAALSAWAMQQPDTLCTEDAATGSVIVETQAEQSGMTLMIRSRQTLHGGVLYTMSVTGYGSAITAEQEDALDTLAGGMLYLGENAATSTQAETIYPDLPDIAADVTAADVRYDVEIPLALDDVPSILYGKTVTVTGTTEASVPMRYYIDDVGYERFTAEADGTFSVTIRFPKTGKQRVRIQAIGDGGYGTATFSVTVKQVAVPVAVAVTEAETSEGVYTLLGRTLPGSEVKLYLRKQVTTGVVNEDGTFSVAATIPDAGTYRYTLRVTCEDWKRNDTPIILTRTTSAEPDEAGEIVDEAAFRKDAVTPTDAVLLGNHEDTVRLVMEGTVTALCNTTGTPWLVVTPTDCTQAVAISVDSLAPWHVGDTGTWLCTLTGGSLTLPDRTRAVMAQMWTAQ